MDWKIESIFLPLQMASNKLMCSKFRKYKGKDYFTQGVITFWESLPMDVVMATSIDGFKWGLDILTDDQSLHNY